MTRERESLRGDTRGVSTTLGYVLGLAIAALLLSGLVLGASGLLDSQRTAAVDQGLEVSGERVATGYADADRLAADATDAEVELGIDLPARVAGTGYTIRVIPDGTGPPFDNTVRLRSDDGRVNRSVAFRTRLPVVERVLSGGRIVVRYTAADELIAGSDGIRGDVAPQPAHTGREDLVFVDGGTLLTVAPTAAGDATVEDGYGVTDAVAVGPKEFDLTGDGYADIPYLAEDGDVYVVNEHADPTRIATADADPPPGETLLGVGTFRGETSVYYVNATNGSTIWRAGVERDPEPVLADGGTVQANTVAGPMDLTGDGTTNLLYTGTSSTARYLGAAPTNSESIMTVSAGSNDGIGAPRNMSDGAVFPGLDTSTQVGGFTDDGTNTWDTTDLPTATPVAAFDWDDDGAMEILYFDDNGRLHLMSDGGTPTEVTRDDGSAVDGDVGSGIA